MATSALQNIEWNRNSVDFFPVAGITSDDFLSPEKQSDLFRRTIEDVAVRPGGWAEFPENQTALWASSGNSLLTAIAPVQYTPVAAILKLAKDWKKEGEMGYILARLQGSREIRHGERIVRRIRALRQMVRDDENEDSDISSDSLRSFFEFLILHPDLNYPDISLTPDGDIYARWKGRDRSLFSVHFLPQSRVRYVVFTPDRKRPDLMDRVSGTSSVDTVLETADRAYGVIGRLRE